MHLHTHLSLSRNKIIRPYYQKEIALFEQGRATNVQKWLVGYKT